ncbi:hypothetical protein D9615_009189 [Tricholomella constricta]|uniref:Uncharacterized protein n=1 Tax=Tricholomella constricta TaxID=117010 RepID=A0A8H5H2B6_9AGAR|nr:hypothetical protein D9615_009189 [Tricholomella constricta]
MISGSGDSDDPDNGCLLLRTSQYADNKAEKLNLLASFSHFSSPMQTGEPLAPIPTGSTLSSPTSSLDSGSDQLSIPIATPIPLPYTARSSSVLRRMISGPKEIVGRPLTLAEQLEGTGEEVEDDKEEDERECAQRIDQVSKFLEHFAASPLDMQPEVHTFHPIRPVSPSTLIALTEPFLMAWCTHIPPSSVAPPREITATKQPILNLVETLPIAAVQSLVDDISSFSRHNVWGY